MDNLGKLQILSIKELLSYQAAIVEDEPDILQHIRKSLSQAFSAQHVHIAFDSFLSGIKLLEMMKDHYHYDLIFLDIEMPEMDGIEVCRQIRKLAPDTLTVFISGKDELVFQTFEVQPFRFIRKSQFESPETAASEDLTAERNAFRRSVFFSNRQDQIYRSSGKNLSDLFGR